MSKNTENHAKRVVGNKLHSSWIDLRPSHKNSTYKFISSVLTISLESAEDICKRHSADAAIIGNVISSLSQNNVDKPLDAPKPSRKWRSSFPCAIPFEDWKESNIIQGVKVVSKSLHCSFSGFTDERLGDKRKELPEHIFIHAELHNRLLNEIPKKSAERYKELIDWLDFRNFRLLKDNPFLETGAIWRYMAALEQCFKFCLQVEEITYLNGETMQNMHNLIHLSRDVLWARYWTEPKIELLEMKALEERRKIATVEREKLLQAFNDCVFQEDAPSKISAEPGTLLVKVLCEMTVNRYILEHNKILNILDQIEDILINFLDLWESFGIQTLTKDDVMTEIGMRKVLEDNFGMDSDYAKLYQSKAMTPAIITSLIRLAGDLVPPERLGGVESEDEIEIYHAAKLLAVIACYFAEGKVSSDLHKKSNVRITPSRTTEELESWVPSAEGRMIMLEATDILKWHIYTNNFSIQSVATSVSYRSEKIIQVQNLLFYVFKGQEREALIQYVISWVKYADNYREILNDSEIIQFDGLDSVEQIFCALNYNFREEFKSRKKFSNSSLLHKSLYSQLL